MTYEIRFREEATQDLTQAASWYERQLPGLGHEFLDTVLYFLNSIADTPLKYPAVHKKIRRALMPRFPFGIFYRVEEGFILIFGVMHGSRDPTRWQGRIA
ncbi:type II toxin-antitoxin system RelE/ParE family toxin [Aliidiomarina sedimenti]|uniref:Type II toxin-antitoxin system RelE/ParE family toxin n=1 Tax=Aliidiomarina sedimenti TaxID=1933879 RepID=A0ABY0C339_9GAMM|nr:type II toxin-antitoxin system RelE/ParE family toxin [Aliidiomarina sedimenti]RUO31870.1 type II toxin-antitoxin system RelE/ParE family toxin [Aliidiomarina sedimenti]